MEKVDDVDIPAPDAHFHESCQKKFYASHSNFQHIKEIVSESDETDFSRKSDEKIFPVNLQLTVMLTVL